MRERRSTHELTSTSKKDKGKQILVIFARCSSKYILLRVSDAYKGYLYFTGIQFLSGYFKNSVSLTVSGAERHIAISEKKWKSYVGSSAVY